MYSTDQEALKAVRDDYHYWSEKLTDTSFQLSFAIIGANWATFGSVDKILNVFWSKLSVASVVGSLGVSVLSAMLLSELHRCRINYAEGDPNRWSLEYGSAKGKAVSWPFTRVIVWLGGFCRVAKTVLPVAAGLFYFIALFRH